MHTFVRGTTYEFMEHSLRLYRETRQHLRMALEEVVRNGCTNIAIYGTGEPAELARRRRDADSRRSIWEGFGRFPWERAGHMLYCSA